MRLLLDTHVWIWSVSEPERLPTSVRTLLEDDAHEVFLSLVSCWEVAIKYGLGRLTLPAPPDSFIPARLERDAMSVLDLQLQDVLDVASLPRHHGDPFDRLLITQATNRGIPIVTADAIFRRYEGIELKWAGA